jgi:flagellar protein FlbD
MGGSEKYINCDLIEKIELTPDTLLVLINGHNFMVRESAEEVVEKIAGFKRRCYANIETGTLDIEEKSG